MRKPRILIHAGTAEVIRRAAEKSIPEEIGGILVGHYEDAALVVTHAIVLPPTEASSNRYVRRDQRANETLQEYLRSREADDPAGYVGEWHSHPGPAGPSSIDLVAMRDLASIVGKPVALLVIRPIHHPILTGVVARPLSPKRARTHKAEIVLVSPIREYTPNSGDHQRLEDLNETANDTSQES